MLRTVYRIGLALLLLLISCTRAVTTGHRFDLIEEEGVPVALTTGGSLYDALLFKVEPLLTLQENLTDQETILFNPNAIQVGPDDRYYVCDAGNGRIAVFSPEGEYERSLGRRGEGPGEFRLMNLQSLHDGILSVFDYSSQRTTHFRTDGTIADIFSSPIGGYALWLDRTREGTYLQGGVRMEQDGTVGFTERRAVIVAPTGRDTLAVIRTGLVKDSYRQIQQMPDGSSIAFGKNLPYSGAPAITYIPGRGILTTDGERPELTWYDTAGRKKLIIRTDLPYLSVTTEMKQDYLNREGARAEQYTNRAGRNPLPSDYEWPETVGFWRRISVDDEGYIWCIDVLSLDQHMEGEEYLFHVIDPEGRYLGVAKLPSSQPRIAGGRLTCFIEDEETGSVVPSIFTLRSAVEGFIYP